MKTKLLKKIRKRFNVFYYPNREKQYVIRDDERDHRVCDAFYLTDKKREHETLASAVKTILEIVKIEYYKFSRKYHKKQIKSKVWYGIAQNTLTSKPNSCSDKRLYHTRPV